MRMAPQWGSVPLMLLVLVVFGVTTEPTPATAAPTVSNDTDEAVSNATGSKSAPSNQGDINVGLVQAAVQRGCAASYTMTCLKLDTLSVLSRMAVPTSYDLLPGITIHRQESKSLGHGLDIPSDLMRSLASDDSRKVDKRLDEYLMARFGNFLDSHSVQVHLLDLQPVASLRRTLGAPGDADSTGRRKNGVWQQLMGAGMMMGGSTLTMGLSALAAMAGKALMLSMLSLVLSALSGMNSGGGGGGGGGGGHSQKQTTYEIISKPIYTHGHSHSAELHHEPTGPAGYGLYGRAKDAAESALAAGTGASGVGGSAIGGPPGSAYITQFPRSLQESSQIPHQTKKVEDDKASLSASTTGNTVGAANYDSLLIRNLQYIKGQDGRAKYAIATPGDLVPSESDYTGTSSDDANGSNNPRKYASHNHDDPAARSFQLSADEEAEDGVAGVAGLAGLYEVGDGVLAGPRSMHTYARLPQMMVVGHPETNQYTRMTPMITSSTFREPLPEEYLPRSASGSSSGSSWEAITPAPPPATPQVNPAFVVAKPVNPPGSSSSSTGEDQASSVPPRNVAYRAYS